jgi:hypothetical protein
MENNIEAQPTNINPVVHPLSPPPKSSPVLMILIILVIIAFGAIGYLFWQNQQLKVDSNQVPSVPQNPQIVIKPEPEFVPLVTDAIPDNWKTYKNQKAGIAFQYPPDWVLTTGESNHMVIGLTKKDLTQEEVILPGDSKEPATYLITIELPPNTGILIPAQTEKMTIDGKTGVRYLEGVAPASGPATFVVVGNSQYVFTYGAMAHEDTHTKYLKTFDQILSTVKFIVL